MNYQSCAEIVLREVSDCVGGPAGVQAAEFVEAIVAAPRVFCDGKGRSGLLAKGFAMRLAQMELAAYAVDGVTTPAIRSGDLLIIASGSGVTPSLVEHGASAKRLGAKIVLLTASTGSLLESYSDLRIGFSAEAKQSKRRSSIQPMGTLFEQSLMLFFDITVLQLMERLGIDNDRMYRVHSNLE